MNEKDIKVGGEKMRKLIAVIDDGQGDNRISGNGGFPAPKKKDIGRKVVVTRICMTWNGCLGYFANDKKQEKHAFWMEELSKKL